MESKAAKFIVENLFNGRIWFLIIGFSLIGYIGYLEYCEAKAEERIKNTAQVISFGGLFIGLFYTMITYEYNHRKHKNDTKHHRDLTSFNIATEWHKKPMVDYISVLSDFEKANQSVIKDEDSSAFQAVLENCKEEKVALFSMFNYFESISLGIKRNMLDEEFVKGFFKSQFTKYYNKYYFYIEFRRRSNNSPSAWKNFTDLANKWSNQN